MVTLQQKRNKSLSHNDEAMHRTSFNGTGTHTQWDKDGKKYNAGLRYCQKCYSSFRSCSFGFFLKEHLN